MNPARNTPASRPPPAALLVWWVVWFSLLAGVGLIYLFLGPRGLPAERTWGGIETVATALVFVSSAIRWLVLPRMKSVLLAFPVFIMGVALAEGCAILGIFLTPFAPELTVVGLLGMAQYVPVFVPRLLAPPEQGFTRRE